MFCWVLFCNIGSTHVWNPDKFAESLKYLHQGGARSSKFSNYTRPVMKRKITERLASKSSRPESPKSSRSESKREYTSRGESRREDRNEERTQDRTHRSRTQVSGSSREEIPGRSRQGSLSEKSPQTARKEERKAVLTPRGESYSDRAKSRERSRAKSRGPEDRVRYPSDRSKRPVESSMNDMKLNEPAEQQTMMGWLGGVVGGLGSYLPKSS
jgi:hypothetical protein